MWPKKKTCQEKLDLHYKQWFRKGFASYAWQHLKVVTYGTEPWAGLAHLAHATRLNHNKISTAELVLSEERSH